MISFLASFSLLDCSEILAGALVAVGCIGELVLVFRKAPSGENELKVFEKRKHVLERVFVCMVAIGVTLELGLLPASLGEVVELQNTNLVLRSNVAALELQVAQTSNNVVKIDPLNQRIAELSAIVRIRVRGRNHVELATSGSRIAVLSLCDRFVDIPSIVSGNRHPHPINLANFAVLESDRFELVKSEQFISPVANPDFHEYLMRFHSDLFSEGDLSGNLVLRTNCPTGKDLNNAKIIWCSVKFLPHDSEIIEGVVIVTANSDVRKAFMIPQQENFRLDPDRPDAEWDYFGLISTNGFPLEVK
jgi:hypothetical protein